MTRHSFRLQALRAHIQSLGCAVNQGTNALDIRVPAAIRALVGVRDTLTEARSLAANVAYGSHDDLLYVVSYRPK